MPINFLLTYCSDCGSLDDMICKLDGALAQFGKNSYQNLSYMTSKPNPYSKIRRMLYYREILQRLKWNQTFYCDFSVSQIVSQVGQLLGGLPVIQKRYTLPTYTTTTTSSTSTTSSSTSTTTSTSSSTTTSTTT